MYRAHDYFSYLTARGFGAVPAATSGISSRNQVDETMGHFGEQIQQVSRPFEKAVTLLDTILGNGREMAEVIVADLGADTCRFPTATHLAA